METLVKDKGEGSEEETQRLTCKQTLLSKDS